MAGALRSGSGSGSGTSKQTDRQKENQGVSGTTGGAGRAMGRRPDLAASTVKLPTQIKKTKRAAMNRRRRASIA